MEGGFMRTKSLYAMGIILVLLAFQGCSSRPEEGLLQRYFNAIKLKDIATMSSMAVDPTGFDVDSWEITAVSEEKASPTNLTDLAKLEADLKKKLEGHAGTVVEAQDIMFSAKEKFDSARSGGAKSAAKKELDEATANFEKEREVHRQIQKEYNDASAMAKKEEDTTLFSLGNPDLANARDLSGMVYSKEVDVTVKGTDGTTKNYRFHLKRYEIRDEAINVTHRGRWVIINFETIN